MHSHLYAQTGHFATAQEMTVCIIAVIVTALLLTLRKALS